MNGKDKKTTASADEPKTKIVKAKATPKSTAKVKATPTEKVAKVEKSTTKAKKTEATTEKVVKAKKTTATKAKATTKAEPKVAKTRAKKAVANVLSEETTVTSKPIVLENPVQEKVAEEVEKVELSPVFKELATPKLPALRQENRAFLQIQSPTRLFFYWSLKQDSDAKLRKVLGSRANDYFYAIRLVNLNNQQEEIRQADNKGSYWFNNIEANTKYRAEVGFYAKNRPFVRLIFSNTIETPRLKPSANTDYQPYFAVTANQFADVLDMAGFSQDAFEVYLAGDEPQIADNATQQAFVKLTGNEKFDFSNINLSELRYILFALASGVSLVALRESVSSYLFDFLGSLVQANPNVLTEEKVILALEEFFGFSPFEDDELTEEFALPTVFGASLINFPKGMRSSKSSFTPNKKRFEQGKLSPISSFSLK